LEVGLAHPIQRAPCGLRVAAKAFGIRVPEAEEPTAGEKSLLPTLGENSEVLVEERSRSRGQRKERPLGVAPGCSGKSARERSESLADGRRNQRAVDRADAVVPRRHPVAVVTEEELVGPFTREHDLDVLTRETGDEVQRDARGERERLVLVPDEPWQRSEELAG